MESGEASITIAISENGAKARHTDMAFTLGKTVTATKANGICA
jgi:hypothetical protein